MQSLGSSTQRTPQPITPRNPHTPSESMDSVHVSHHVIMCHAIHITSSYHHVNHVMSCHVMSHVSDHAHVM